MTSEYLLIKKKNKTFRYPNLNTVIMVENYLKNNSDIPIKLSELKKELPKKIMFQTLKVILEYLYASNKIVYGPKGIQWAYKDNDKLNLFLKDCYEIKYE